MLNAERQTLKAEYAAFSVQLVLLIFNLNFDFVSFKGTKRENMPELPR